MYCIKTKHTVESFIKKSRFIGIVMPCHTLHDVQTNLKQCAAEYQDASHIAYAYRLKTDNGLLYRFYDAGEPTGTAGKPIFQHIEGKQLINVLIVVIRYFGGVKLGAGGLTRAYGNAAKDVIDASTLMLYIELQQVRLVLAYSQLQSLTFLLKKLEGEIIEQNFSGQVELVVQLPVDNVTTLLQSFPT